MFTHYRTQGFIFKKTDRGEADQLFSIYTKDFGRLEVLGKAIRKIKSKLRSGAELFYLSEIEFIQGKTYKTLTDAILIDKFDGLRKNLRKLAITHKISEIFDQLVKNQEADKKIWQLLKTSFERLNSLKIDDEKLEILYYYFFWNFISLLGYKPELYKCIFCQSKLTPEQIYFNSKEGGVICPNCFKKIKNKSDIIKINSDIIKIIRLILKRDWDILSRLKIDSIHKKILKTISKNFYSTIPS